MRFGLLGSLAVHDDAGRTLDVGGNQSRMVLAVLLAASGRVVTAEALVDALWGEAPPSSAPGTLQSYVSRLRRELEPDRPRGAEARVLLWEPPGYRLAVDATTSTSAGSRPGRPGPRRAGGGPAGRIPRPFAGGRAPLARTGVRRVPGPGVRHGAGRPVGGPAHCRNRGPHRRELALGNHAAVVGELAELVKAHPLPLQEGFRASLALALYRSGRQSEALRSLADARETLRDELGVDLGRPL